MSPRHRKLLTALVITAALLTLAMLLGSYHWLPNLLTHFRLPCAIGFIALLVLTIFAKTPKASTLTAILLAIQIHPLGHHYQPFTKDQRSNRGESRGESFSIMTFNVLRSNEHYRQVEELIRNENPDFVCLQETTTAWTAALAPLSTQYPHTVSQPQSDPFGLLFLSKYPISQQHLDRSKELGTPLLKVQVKVKAPHQRHSRELTIITAHPLPPTNRAAAQANRATLTRLRSESERRTTPILITGDFNCTAYSPSFRLLGKDLRDSARGRGYAPTWQRGHPLLGIPIDYILYSEDLICQSRRIGPRTGSDHSPTIATFQFRDSPTAQPLP